MPENLPTIDTPSDKLDLNSDTQRVSTITESSVTIGVSVATKISSEGGKTTDEVRVSTSEVNFVGTSTHTSDAFVEGYSNEELVVSELENQDEVQQTVIEVVNVECTTITTESVEAGVMNEVKVSGSDGLEAEEMVGRVGDFLDGDGGQKDEYEDTAARFAGMVSDQVNFHERMDSPTVEENQNDEACDTVDSSSVAQVTEGSQDENPNSEVQVSGYHASEEEEEGECLRETIELPVEQYTDVAGEELGEMDNVEEVMEPNGEVSGNDALDDVEENDWLEAEEFNGSEESHRYGDYDLNESNSIQDTKQEMINQLTENDSDQVFGPERTDLHPGEENKDVCVDVDSTLCAEVSDVCEAKAAYSSSLQCGDDPDSAPIDESVETIVDENLGLEVQITDHLNSEDTEKPEIPFAEAGSSVLLNESLVEHNEQIKVVDVGDVTLMDNSKGVKLENAVSVSDALHENPLGVEKNVSLEAEAVGGSAASFATGNLGYGENTSKQADGYETLFQVAQTTNMDTRVQVTEGRALEDEELETEPDVIKLGISTVMEQVQVVGGETTGSNVLDGNSVYSEEYKSLQAEAISESYKSCPSCIVNTPLQDEKQEVIAQVGIRFSVQPDGDDIMDSHPDEQNPHGDAPVIVGSNSIAKVSDGSETTGACVQVTEDHDTENEGQKSVVETVKEGGSLTKNEALIEQIQFVGGEFAALGNEESFKTKDNVSGTEILHKNTTSMLDGKQEMVSQLTEMNSKQVRGDAMSNSFSVQDCLDIEDCPSAYSSLAVKVIDGTQSTGMSTSFEANLDSDIRSHMALLHEDQNMASHVFETDASSRQLNHTPDAEVTPESAGGSSKLDGSQITKSNVFQAAISELNSNECIMDGIVKDFCISSSREGNQNTGGVVVTESISPGDMICVNGDDEHKQMEGDVDLSVLDPLDDDAAVDASEFHAFKGLSESDVASPLSGARKHSEEGVEHAILFSENEEHASSVEVQLVSQEVGEHAIPASWNGEQASHIEVQLENQESSPRKRKHILEEGSNSNKRERSLSEFSTGENLSPFHDNDDNEHGNEKAVIDSASLSSGKELEVVESFLDDSMVKNRKQRLSPSRDTDAEPPTPQSFKVGDCIRRIASQLTGAPPVLMSRGERFQESAGKVEGVDCSPQTCEGSQGRRVVIPKEYSYPDEMLSQLCLAARDPMKGYSFLAVIVDFFSEFRNSIVLDCKSEKMGIGNTVAKKSSNTKISSVETFDFEDTNDSYWTDRIVQLQGISDEQPLKTCKDNTQTDRDSTSIKPGSDSDNKSSRKNRKRKGESGTWVDDPAGNSLQLTPSLDISMKKPAPKPRRRKVDYIQTPVVKKSPIVDRLNPKLPYNWQNLDVNNENNNAPTALILSFTEIRRIPSEVNLNKIFGRFGPLKFSETEISEETNSARVVFKRQNDAEVALSSATAFSIFGSASVSYQLMPWSPSPSKASPFASTVGGQDVTFMEGNTT